jgi:hypothetical protein
MSKKAIRNVKRSKEGVEKYVKEIIAENVN